MGKKAASVKEISIFTGFVKERRKISARSQIDKSAVEGGKTPAVVERYCFVSLTCTGLEKEDVYDRVR